MRRGQRIVDLCRNTDTEGADADGELRADLVLARGALLREARPGTRFALSGYR